MDTRIIHTIMDTRTIHTIMDTRIIHIKVYSDMCKYSIFFIRENRL
jgi:hypothetical protein